MDKENTYQNKLFSVLGDSISTLDGYSEPNYAAFYEGRKKFETNVFSPEDTWWGQVIAHLEGFFLANNSFSGSMVHKSRYCEIESYGCSDERTSSLHKGEQMPDIIMIFMGINDWGAGTQLTATNEAQTQDIGIFSVAYETMLKKLQKNYPEAKLWCLTLPVGTRKDQEDFVYPYQYRGKHIEEYSEIIRASAKKHNCHLIEMYHPDMPYDSIDGFHPNAEGMKTLAETIIKSLQEV